MTEEPGGHSIRRTLHREGWQPAKGSTHQGEDSAPGLGRSCVHAGSPAYVDVSRVRQKKIMEFHRYCSPAISPYTEERYGIFVAVWHLIRDKRVTPQEEADYWSHREWYEAHLPVPPHYADGNPRRAITWFKDSTMEHPLLHRLSFYRELA